jgi:hypothetical protein
MHGRVEEEALMSRPIAPALTTIVVMMLTGCGTGNPAAPTQAHQVTPTSAAAAQTFTNASSIAAPSGAPAMTRGPASPYPSTIRSSSDRTRARS